MNASSVIGGAIAALSGNQSIMSNPNARHMLGVLSSGDGRAIETLARNLCASYGVSPEDAARSAMSFFGIR